MKLSILVATRGRYGILKRLHSSIVDTVKCKENVELVFCADSDDRDTIMEICNLCENNRGIFVKCVFSKEIILAEKWNECWRVAGGEAFMLCDDDIVFRTKDWDSLVVNAFNKYDDKIVFVYGRDTPETPKGGTHGFLHRNWTNAIGYFVPPYFRTWYVDTWLNFVAASIDRRYYIHDFYTDHLHVGRGLADLDDTYRRGSHSEKGDVKTIWKTTEHKRLEDVEKLRRVINSGNITNS